MTCIAVGIAVVSFVLTGGARKETTVAIDKMAANEAATGRARNRRVELAKQ